MTSRLATPLLLGWMLQLLTGGHRAHAQTDPPDDPKAVPQEVLPQEVLHAEELIAQGDFEDAVRLLQEILREGEPSKQALLETYRLMGLAALYLGNEPRARQAYDLLVELAPRYELAEDTPPKVRALVETARKERLERQKAD